MTSMRVNRRLEELSGFHLGLLQYFLQKGWKRVQNGSVFPPKNASKLEVNQNAEVKVITVAPRRPNPSSTSDSKRGLNTIPTYSKRSHLDAQRCRTNCMIVAVISGLFFSGLFAVWACCQMTIQEALTPKSICKGPVHPGRLAYNSLLTLEDSMDIFTKTCTSQV